MNTFQHRGLKPADVSVVTRPSAGIGYESPKPELRELSTVEAEPRILLRFISVCLVPQLQYQIHLSNRSVILT